MQEGNLELGELTERVIGAAINVHRALGPGFLESIYENVLAIELERRGVVFRRQFELDVRYQGRVVGRHRLDLLIEDRLVVELKSVKAFEDVHFATTRSYIHSLHLKHGLLFNFNAVTLQVRRVLAKH